MSCEMQLKTPREQQKKSADAAKKNYNEINKSHKQMQMKIAHN